MEHSLSQVTVFTMIWNIFSSIFLFLSFDFSVQYTIRVYGIYGNGGKDTPFDDHFQSYITQHAGTLVGWWCARSIVRWVLSWVVAVRPGWSWKQWSVVLLWNIDVQEATRPVGSRPPPITGWPGQLAANRRSGWRHGQRPQTSWSEVSQPGAWIRRLRTNGGPGSVSEANIAGGRACEHCGPRDHEPWSATWLL